MKRIIVLLYLTIIPFFLIAQKDDGKPLVYKFEINKEIMPAMWRITKNAITEAEKLKADYIIIRMNTYGGAVDAADSIRTRILNCDIPVMVFIDNNAASAGALIAIAADSIYMRQGANIGAATVVDQTGKVVPDKYQSYMRATMRSTAEAHGKKKKVVNGDTTYVWHRDPRIAEAMVDPRTYIKEINDTGKVLTMTMEEAIKYGYCEGHAESIKEALELAGIKDYTIKSYQVTTLDKVMGFLTNPFFQGVLIMLIVAGIYFELQTPGIGFPLAAAFIAALLYFAPLYLEGLAANWEIILFIIGLILIAVEIFALPGFGVAGILGIAFIVVGLAMALIDNNPLKPFGRESLIDAANAFLLVIISITISALASIYISSRIFASKRLRWSLAAEQSSNEGYVGVDAKELKSLTGKHGKSLTVLRPSGTVEVDGEMYDACSIDGFIDQNTNVLVVRSEAGQIYVRKMP